MKAELRSNLAGLEAPWEALRQSSAADHVFMSYRWQAAWWEIFGARDRLHLIALWDGGDLAGLAPLYRDGRTLRLIGGTELADYLDLLYRPEAAPALFEAIGNHLGEAGQLDLDLCSLPAASPTIGHLRALAGTGQVSLAVEVDNVCPAVDLEGGWDGYLGRLTKKDRHELRRKLRRLEANHQVAHEVITDRREIRAAWPDFFRLHTLSRPDKMVFLTDDVRRFFECLGESLEPAAGFQLHFLKVDGERVSAVICFAQGDELWLYNSGYDPAYRHLSVGLLIKAYCLRRAAEAGLRRFDLLRGREPYKYDLGATDRPIYRLRVARGENGARPA